MAKIGATDEDFKQPLNQRLENQLFSIWYNELTEIVGSNTSVSLKNLKVKIQPAREWFDDGLTPAQAFAQMQCTVPL